MSSIIKIFVGCISILTLCTSCGERHPTHITEALRAGFMNPPDSSKPGVYWYFMDGNMSRSAITEDLLAMKNAGIAYVIFLEVNLDVPRGTVNFLSEEWQNLFAFLVNEAKRLGITVTLGIGPGWTGSGGPWVAGHSSMQHLVASSTTVQGGKRQKISLLKPPPVRPYFGEKGLGADLHKKWIDFSEDVAVLAFPAIKKPAAISNRMEKALFYRAPFSSTKNVAAYLLPDTTTDANGELIQRRQIIDLTDSVDKDGLLNWTVPAGNWTVMRFVARNNGAVTRPAPLPGVGFEADKFDTSAINAHLDHYVGKLLSKIGGESNNSTGGLKMLHIDSWEMGAQNWSPNFRQEFIKRRGYDPLPFYPVYEGIVVDSKEVSERFLWDLRLTAQELVIENHAKHVKQYAHRVGLGLSVEPYDMNPTADLELGSVADIPMCEFWSRGMGFNTAFSTIEATSIGHIEGHAVVAAEAFTSCDKLAWTQFPGAMKNQTDWALAAGINRFYFHTFQHQPLNSKLKPGMTMGGCGIHWNRNQTFWPMVGEYHKYLSRCQYLLQQGRSNADILYLTPEGAPQVFQPPYSALSGDSLMPDRKAYNFDGCSPGQLLSATVKDKKIVFPSGSEYSILILPQVENVSVKLLNKIKALVNMGAPIVGSPFSKANGLTGFPATDEEVKKISRELWSETAMSIEHTSAVSKPSTHRFGKGIVISGGAFKASGANLYPDYEPIARWLQQSGTMPDLVADPNIRYTHRTINNAEIYFVSNKTNRPLTTPMTFSAKGHAELWNPMTGVTGKIHFSKSGRKANAVTLTFRPYESYFVIISDEVSDVADYPIEQDSSAFTIKGKWNISFDTTMGGPASVVIDSLIDWRSSTDSGIKYYSGIARYTKSFDLPSPIQSRVFLDLGNVKNIARIILNDKPLGVVWADPWRVEVTGTIRQQNNKLEIEVANLWINRMIGDDAYPDDGVKNVQWPSWLVENKPRPSKRISFVTNELYHRSDTLMPSGLLGPVTIVSTNGK